MFLVGVLRAAVVIDESISAHPSASKAVKHLLPINVHYYYLSIKKPLTLCAGHTGESKLCFSLSFVVQV